MADQKKKEKRCFVICPIGESGSEIRARSNDIFDHLVRPIAEAAGYVAHRVIDNDRPGDITSKIIGDILSADAIVADITGHNPNVFYELAIAHAWKKPCILLSGDDPLRVPFDIASQNVISLRTESFGAFETTKKLVAKHFNDIADGKAGLENPVARFERGKELEKSGNPLAAELAELREEIAGLKADKWVAREIELIPGAKPMLSHPSVILTHSIAAKKRLRQAELGLPDSTGQIFDENRGWAKPEDD